MKRSKVKKEERNGEKPLTISSCYLSYKMPGIFRSVILKDRFLAVTTLMYSITCLPLAINDKEMSGQFKWTNKANTAWQSSTVILFSQCPPSPASYSVS